MRFRISKGPLCLYFHSLPHPNRSVFLVCPMKSAPVLVRREEGGQDYTHTVLPTQGEVHNNASSTLQYYSTVQ